MEQKFCHMMISKEVVRSRKSQKKNSIPAYLKVSKLKKFLEILGIDQIWYLIVVNCLICNVLDLTPPFFVKYFYNCETFNYSRIEGVFFGLWDGHLFGEHHIWIHGLCVCVGGGMKKKNIFLIELPRAMMV